MALGSLAVLSAALIVPETCLSGDLLAATVLFIAVGRDDVMGFWVMDMVHAAPVLNQYIVQGLAVIVRMMKHSSQYKCSQNGI